MTNAMSVSSLINNLSSVSPSGDGQVDFEEFMTILGPKLLSSETREGFLGSTIDTIFWQVNLDSLLPLFSVTLLSHEMNWI